MLTRGGYHGRKNFDVPYFIFFDIIIALLFLLVIDWKERKVTRSIFYAIVIDFYFYRQRGGTLRALLVMVGSDSNEIKKVQVGKERKKGENKKKKRKRKMVWGFFFERVTYYFLLERGKNNLRFLHKKMVAITPFFNWIHGLQLLAFEHVNFF